MHDSAKAVARRRSLISIFILFHLVAITCWAWPWDPAPVRDIRELVRPYMVWSGLFQRWDMFAPNPRPVNSFVRAVVITDDRHMKVWKFPRMEELGLGERYRKERYRKFLEVVLDRQNQALWPDVANHVARQFNNPADPPEKVLLIQYQSEIKPWHDSSASAPEPDIFFEEYVDPGELR